jgi:RNA polymerase sigma factor (sigma-70 family)
MLDDGQQEHRETTVTAAQHRDDASSADDGLATFIGARSRLFGIAYRIVGSCAEAEDVVQDVWLRWQATDRSVIVDPAAFLVTTTTRLAINAARSARARRSTHLEPWLPEAVDTAADPEAVTERSQALGIAVFLLLEKLPPTERAAYVLSHAFDYSYARIAAILQVSEANARQLASRARKHLIADGRQPVRPAAQQRLLETLRVAAHSGEHSALEELLAGDVGDAGQPLAVRPLENRSPIADGEETPSPARADRRIEPRPLRRDGAARSQRHGSTSSNGFDRFQVRHVAAQPPSAVARRTA